MNVDRLLLLMIMNILKMILNEDNSNIIINNINECNSEQ